MVEPDLTEAVLFFFVFFLSSLQTPSEFIWPLTGTHLLLQTSRRKNVGIQGRFNEPVNLSQLRVYSVSAVYLKPNECPAARHDFTQPRHEIQHLAVTLKECCISFLYKSAFYVCQYDSLITVGRWFDRLVSFGHALQQSVKMCTFLNGVQQREQELSGVDRRGCRQLHGDLLVTLKGQESGQTVKE